MSGERDTAAALPLHSQETELEVVKRLAHGVANRVMLDVGASAGVFASYFGSLGWEVHAFEPCPEVFAKLSANLSSMATVRCHPLALTDRDGAATLHIAARPDGTVMDIYHTLTPYSATADFQWKGSTDIPCLRLDSACASLGITRNPGILKIDTAGSEFQVLKGMGEVLPEVIMVEFWEDAHPFGPCPSPPDLMLEFLRGRGYRDYFFITRNGEEELIQVNTQYLRPGDWGNIILIHEDARELVRDAMPELVLRSQLRLLRLVQMYRAAAAERLDIIQQLSDSLQAHRTAAQERLDVIRQLDGSSKLSWKIWRFLSGNRRSAKG